MTSEPEQSTSGAQLDFSKSMSYGDYLHLDEKLTDIEDSFRQWRFRHVTTVERIIRFKPGTGGTQGVGYLRAMLDVLLFPELWKLRTDL